MIWPSGCMLTKQDLFRASKNLCSDMNTNLEVGEKASGFLILEALFSR